jgi:hypothetical protein
METKMIRDDITELKRLMELRDDTEYKLTKVQAKIIGRLDHTKTQEILKNFGVVMRLENCVWELRTQDFVDFEAECRSFSNELPVCPQTAREFFDDGVGGPIQ